MKKFVRNEVDVTPIVDNVFSIVSLAKEDIAKNGPENVVDATIGSLYGEDGKLVALDSVFTHYNEIANREKAKYAASFRGNPDYQETVYKWVTQGKQLSLNHTVVATPGGSGAVNSTILYSLDVGETLVIPEIAWGNYKLMAKMANINSVTYTLFDGQGFNVKSFEEVCTKVMEEQGKVSVIINDPCHNPTGYSLTKDEWEQVIAVINKLSETGPVILLNDIAYIDYSYDFKGSRDYMEVFNKITDNVLIIVAFSISKSLTSYGLRCGAALLLSKNLDALNDFTYVMEKNARAAWSNIPNAAMENFVYVVGEGLEAYDKEKQYYVDLLEKRSNIFKSEADACGLEYYPYKEGFFVTVKIEDADRLNKYHQALMDHHIYTVKVTKGIRVALCSISVAKATGLAYKMKDILDTID